MLAKRLELRTNQAYDPMRHGAELTVIVWPGDKAEIFTSRGQSVIVDADQFAAFLVKCSNALATAPQGSD